ncbi:MAG: TssQ family T6SS-associated lipoprotein [Gemmatimonadota bacterium]
MTRTLAVVLLLAAALTGCQTIPPPPPPAPPPTTSVAALYQQPAERALILGLSLYDQGAFERADQAFRDALKAGLHDRRDVATANKYLAFIACAFNRIDECRQDFRAAFAADDKFSLTQAEIGHPIWGPVYRQVAAEQGRKQ